MAVALAGERALDNMQMWTLLPHPDTPEPAVRALSVAVERTGERLWLRYVVECDMEAIQWPAPAAPAFTDGLWQHTCFEVFMRGEESTAYVEGNFSPSWEYAFYGFSGYREGMTALPRAEDPQISFDAAHDQFALETTIDLASIASEMAAIDWTIGLSAVIENVEGGKSYYALAHPGGAPDFHHASCFALELKA